MVYAGKCINSAREFADLRVLNLQSMEWYNPYFSIHGGDPDEIPPCRKRHSGFVANNKFYVFAGWQGNRNAGSYWADFYILDLGKLSFFFVVYSLFNKYLWKISRKNGLVLSFY